MIKLKCAKKARVAELVYAYDSKSYESNLVWVRVPPRAPIKIMSEKVAKKIKEEIEQTKRALKEKTATLIIGGFGLVAALAWNEAIKSLFDAYFKESNGLIGKFIYALIITVIVVIVSIRLGKISEKKE